MQLQLLFLLPFLLTFAFPSQFEEGETTGGGGDPGDGGLYHQALLQLVLLTLL